MSGRWRSAGARRLLVAALVALLLAGCGGSSGPPTPSSPSAVPSVPNSRVLWGMFQEHYPPDYSEIGQTTSRLNRPTQVLHEFYSWRDDPQSRGGGGVRSFMSQTIARGQIPLVTWEPWGTTDAAIASGANDATIDSWAKVIAAQHREVWVRVFHEFNDPYDPTTRSGYPWGVAGGTQNTPEQMVAAWRHIHDRFRAVGATNVKFVWTPDGVNMANNAALLRAAYPGDAYVDYTGWDTYGTYPNQDDYQVLTRVAPGKQAVIAELGVTSAELPALVGLSNSINGGEMPLVRAVVWFDQGRWALPPSSVTDPNISVLAALRSMLSGPAFQTT